MALSILRRSGGEGGLLAAAAPLAEIEMVAARRPGESIQCKTQDRFADFFAPLVAEV
jgi:hypothetical protein